MTSELKGKRWWLCFVLRSKPRRNLIWNDCRTSKVPQPHREGWLLGRAGKLRSSRKIEKLLWKGLSHSSKGRSRLLKPLFKRTERVNSLSHNAPLWIKMSASTSAKMVMLWGPRERPSAKLWCVMAVWSPISPQTSSTFTSSVTMAVRQITAPVATFWCSQVAKKS